MMPLISSHLLPLLTRFPSSHLLLLSIRSPISRSPLPNFLASIAKVVLSLDPLSPISLFSPSRSDPSSLQVNEWKEEGKKEVKNGMIDANDAFWEKLKLAVENKVGAAEAQRFCKNFLQIHRKLVYEELSLDTAYRFINSSKISTE